MYKIRLSGSFGLWAFSASHVNVKKNPAYPARPDKNVIPKMRGLISRTI